MVSSAHPNLQAPLERLEARFPAASKDYCLELAVASFCDPTKYHLLIEDIERISGDPRLVITVGLHPKDSHLAKGRNSSIKPHLLQSLRGLLLLPEVKGLGEVGIDASQQRQDLEIQKDTLRALLTSLNKEVVS